MSLQVWLPLNGNLNNQGLSEVTVTNSGATVASNGKIGSCYLVNSDKKISFSSYPWMTMKPQYSFSCFFWVKGTTNGWLFACSAWEFMLRPSFIQVHLAGNGQYPARYTATFDTNTWYHLGFTWSGTEGKLRLYLNGSLVATSDVPSSASYDIASSFNIPYDGPRYINDFRLYDHCLSAKEVKEISKGLICHYKLNNNGFGNPNLINTDNPLKAGGRTVVTDKKLIISAIDTTADTYFTINLAEAIQADVEYTLSCDVEDMNCNTNWNFPLFAQGNPISKILVISPNTSKASITFTVPTESSYVGKTIIFMDDGGRPSTNPNDITLSNFKLEKGSVATPWCPHTSDSLYTSLGLDSITESDCSGYKNDGNKIGNALPSSESGRYSTSTYCNSTNIGTSTPTGAAFIKCALVNPIINATTLTINWWGNIEDYSYQNSGILSLSNDPSYPSDYMTSALAQYDSIFRFNLTDGNYSSIDSLALIETGNWHMYTLVFNNGTVQGYRDGVSIISNSKSGTLAQFSYIYMGINVAGGAYRQTKSKWSDFRIYSTALSASDIKELYSTSASIDKNGNMYAYEFKEE